MVREKRRKGSKKVRGRAAMSDIETHRMKTEKHLTTERTDWKGEGRGRIGLTSWAKLYGPAPSLAYGMRL